MIRVVLPHHLRTLAKVGAEVEIAVEGAVTQRSVIDAIEARFPVLRGTIRDHTTHVRRPFLRFFACEEDLSHESPDAPLPDAVARGKEPYLIIGAIAGGQLPLAVFTFEEALPVLERTPAVLRALLSGLPAPWIETNEGPGSWSPFDIVGHLIHGERTDWVPRIEHILRHGDEVAFPPFDREAMFAASEGFSLENLLAMFAELRRENLARLARLGLTRRDLTREGRHPEFGVVTLGQHLSTWVAHDLSHVGQIVRVMGRRYADEVGPWGAYLPMLGRAARERRA